MADGEHTVPLKEYFEKQLWSVKEYFDLRTRALDEATKVARDEMNRRLEQMNELREQVNRREANAVSRAEHDKVTEEIKAHGEVLATIAGKASQSALLLTLALALTSLLVSAGVAVMMLFSLWHGCK